MRGSATEDHCRKGSQQDILLFTEMAETDNRDGHVT